MSIDLTTVVAVIANKRETKLERRNIDPVLFCGNEIKEKNDMNTYSHGPQ